MSEKPSPKVTAVSRRFWEACNRDQLLLQRCQAAECRRYVFYPRVCCPYCAGSALSWEVASGRGRIVSFTLVHRPQHESFYPEAPYYYIVVQLEEGPIIYSRLHGSHPGEVDLMGREVQVAFVDHVPGQRIAFFDLSLRATLT